MIVDTAITTADAIELQGVLESSDPEERLSKALVLVTKEKEVAKLQKDINRQVEEKMAKSQREYFLREQLKSIKKELGLERDDKDEMLGKFGEKIAEMETREVDDKVIAVIKDEMRKLGRCLCSCSCPCVYYLGLKGRTDRFAPLPCC